MSKYACLRTAAAVQQVVTRHRLCLRPRENLSKGLDGLGQPHKPHNSQTRRQPANGDLCPPRQEEEDEEEEDEEEDEEEEGWKDWTSPILELGRLKLRPS